MGETKELLLKHFLLAKNAWIRSILTVLSPILFAIPILLIGYDVGDGIKERGGCDHQVSTLAPSHPLFALAGFVCNADRCSNKQPNYLPPSTIMRTLTGETESESTICPGATVSETENLIRRALAQVCLPERSENINLRQIGALDYMFRGQVLYYPNTPDTKRFMTAVARPIDQLLKMNTFAGFKTEGSQAETVNITLYDEVKLKTFKFIEGLANLTRLTTCYRRMGLRMKGFGNKTAATDYARSLDKTKRSGVVWGIVALESLTNHFQYTLICQQQTRRKFSTLYLQSLLDAAATGYLTDKYGKDSSKTAVPKFNLQLKNLPLRCTKSPGVFGLANFAGNLVVGFGFAVISYTMLIDMSREKSLGLAEFLYISGVSRWKVRLTWFIYGLIFVVPVAGMIAALLKYSITNLVEHTPLWIILVFSGLYGGSCLSFTFLLSSLITVPEKAMVIFVLSTILGMNLPSWSQLLPEVGYTGLSLLVVRVGMAHPVFAAQIFFGYLLEWEQKGDGIRTDQLFESPAEEDDFGGIAEVLIWQAVQIPVYQLISWYLEYVLPSKYGLQLPPYFFLTFQFWTGKTLSQLRTGNGNGTDSEQQNDPKDSISTNKLPSDIGGDINEPQSALIEDRKSAAKKTPGIKIVNLSKRYGKMKAVNNLSITFYSSEISAFLGQNGAGKSTTMNILTGMIAPTTGTAFIDGRDIRTDMADIRTVLGFCPQYDLIYPDMTVREHMLFYGKLKQLTEKEIDANADDLFSQMKMTDALNRKAGQLSGGMKRKLSIAIAFLGNPKIVILDEPTSAIDPFSRRTIWDVILSFRHSATILISTHYMQEADVLGDRIAIIDHGQLKCFGSSMFLKSNFGNGIQLKLAHSKPIVTEEVYRDLREILPLTMVASTATETTFSIPIPVAKSEKMIGFLTYVEKQIGRYGVQTFGVAESSLEQVFFRISEAGQKPESPAAIVDAKLSAPTAADDNRGVRSQLFGEWDLKYSPMKGPRLFAAHFTATFVKRFHLARKSAMGVILQLVAPMVFCCLLLFITKILEEANISGARELVRVEQTDPAVGYHGPSDHPLLRSIADFGMGPSCSVQIGPAKSEATLKAKAELSTSCNSSDDQNGNSSRTLLPFSIRNHNMNETSGGVPGSMTNSGFECTCFICEKLGDESEVGKAKYRTPPEMNLRTDGIRFINFNGRNLTDYLLKTPVYFKAFGAIEIIPIPDSAMIGYKRTELGLIKELYRMGVIKSGGGGVGFGIGKRKKRSVDLLPEKTPANATRKNVLPAELESFIRQRRAVVKHLGSMTVGKRLNTTADVRVSDVKKPWALDPADYPKLSRRKLHFRDRNLLRFVNPDVITLWTGIQPPRRRPTERELEMFHNQARFLNYFSNAMVRSATQRADVSITMYAEEAQFMANASVTQAISGIILAYIGSIALLIPSFNSLIQLTSERASGSKKLQLIMGLGKLAYWTANFLWDVSLFLISLCLMVGFMMIFPDLFSFDLYIFTLLGVFYGVSLTLFSYILSLILNSSKIPALVQLIIVPMTVIATIILRVGFSGRDWYDGVSFVASLFPPFFMSDTIVRVEFNSLVPEEFRLDNFSYDILGRGLMMNATFSVLCLCLLLIGENWSRLVRCCQGIRRASKARSAAALSEGGGKVAPGVTAAPESNNQTAAEESSVGFGEQDVDPDVFQEACRVKEATLNLNRQQDPMALAVQKLKKTYPNGVQAVRGVSFGVREGECFGLLGMNGAGKTTLFRMLTQFERPSHGDAKIGENSLFYESSCPTTMSYCPQQDTLFDILSPAEHLQLYSRIRGIPSRKRSTIIREFMVNLGLDQYAARGSSRLSGGNKRKLNLAIALLDFPPVIFLDEMTTGLDPKARKQAWSLIQQIIKSRKCSAVITSHSMEECEEHCNRIAIMVNGLVKSIGGIQYLKDKFGNNYSVKVRLTPGTNVEILREAFKDAFPSSVVQEEHLGYLEVQIPANAVRLSTMYRAIHEIREGNPGIEEFSVSQTTLEHVFVNLIKNQE